MISRIAEVNQSRVESMQQQTQSSASAGTGAWSSSSAQSQVSWQSSGLPGNGVFELFLALVKRILTVPRS